MEKEKARGSFSEDNRLPELPEGRKDCYWCGRVDNEENMTKVYKYDILTYVCKKCM